jgi:phosphatidylinositol alpha-1,6-mannosyltransferase
MATSRRRLRVAIVTPELHRRGGTERCLAEQVERWRERFDLRLYTMRVEGVTLEGVRVRRIPWIPGPLLLRYLWWFAANHLARWWDTWRVGPPDVVHSPGVNCFDAEAMSIHIVFAKYWERVRGGVLREMRSPRLALRAVHRVLYWTLIRMLERRVYRGPATIWAISGEDAGELERRFGRPPGSVPVVTHGVDAGHFSPGTRAARRAGARMRLGLDGSRVVLLVGNDALKKGVDCAIAALCTLPEDVVLAVAGRVDGDLVRQWASAAGVGGRVLLWPHIPDVLDYYAAADVFVAPSREDAFHLPTLEALACGLPSVVSSRAGVAALIEDGRHALVLRDPEDVGELSRHLLCLLDDPDLAARLAREGRALAKRCSWDANADRAAALIEREATTPRVLVLASDAWGTGGIERVTRTLVRALADAFGAERVGLLSLYAQGDKPLPCRLLYSGRRRHWGRISLAEKMAYLAACLSAARRWRKRLAVVACHPHLAPVARACAAVAGRPYAVWCHGEEVWRPLRPAVRAALVAADAVFVPSRFTARQVERWAGLREGSVRVIPHCLPPDFPTDGQRKPTPSARVLAVARLVPEHAYKGVDTLLSAWPAILAQVPEAELVVIGEGPDRARLDGMARSLGLNGRVRFLGAVSDEHLARCYAEAAVFALPSRYRVGPRAEGEGFGLVLLEAAAMGLPVVAGRSGAVPEVVRDGETGLLVDPEDPRAVAEAVVRLLADRDLARRLGETGRRWVTDQFAYARFRDGVARLVRDLAALGGPEVVAG